MTVVPHVKLFLWIQLKIKENFEGVGQQFSMS